MDLEELLQEESLAVMQETDVTGIPTPESILTDQELERIMDRSDAAYEEKAVIGDGRFDLVGPAEASADLLASLH